MERKIKRGDLVHYSAYGIGIVLETDKRDSISKTLKKYAVVHFIAEACCYGVWLDELKVLNEER